MAIELIDPRKAMPDPLKVLAEDRQRRQEPSSAELVLPSRPAIAQALSQGDEDRMRADFRVFLTAIWRYFGYADPSPLQLSIAHFIQHSPQRAGVMAFRGASKSWIAGAFALWLFYRNPEEKVLITSGSAKRALASTNWCLMLILQVPFLRYLSPKPFQRSSSQGFDVGPSAPSQTPSFHASGITGQVVGFRGSFILNDDVETQTNSITVNMREKTRDSVKEFDSILLPDDEEHGRVSRIMFLGTPHDADSLYNHLDAFTFMVWPAVYPSDAERKVYLFKKENGAVVDRLAPYIKARLAKDPSLVGQSTEPGRFPLDDLMRRKASMGSSEFALQFLLDTTLSDRNKYPLKLRELIVMPLDGKRAPETLTWGPIEAIKDLPLLGFQGDRFYRPAFTAPHFQKFETITGFVDPSGRGEDETAMSIVASLFGTIFLLWQGAWQDGSSTRTLLAIAEACVRWGVQDLEVEGNFGDGMFLSLLRPVMQVTWENVKAADKQAGRYDLSKSYGTSLTEVTSGNTAKELRILSILEPITQQHRLVVNEEVIRADLKSIEEKDGQERAHHYTLFYQYTHLTRARDSLKHEDRLESLAGACRRYAAMLGVDPKGMAVRASQEREDAFLDRMLMNRLEAGQPVNLLPDKPADRRPVALSPTRR